MVSASSRGNELGRWFTGSVVPLAEDEQLEFYLTNGVGSGGGGGGNGGGGGGSSRASSNGGGGGGGGGGATGEYKEDRPKSGTGLYTLPRPGERARLRLE